MPRQLPSDYGDTHGERCIPSGLCIAEHISTICSFEMSKEGSIFRVLIHTKHMRIFPWNGMSLFLTDYVRTSRHNVTHSQRIV